LRLQHGAVRGGFPAPSPPKLDKPPPRNAPQRQHRRRQPLPPALLWTALAVDALKRAPVLRGQRRAID